MIPARKSQAYIKQGIYTSEARLKKPDEIVGQFMTPAIKALRNKTGKDEGRAYHAFAAFCDQQLQNQDLIDDYNRMRTLAERREAEASEYERLVKAEKSSSKKERLKREGRKARQWFQMDMAEAKRLGDNRLKFLCEGLENYLLALQASDEHDKDVFRMFSLWLEYSDLQLANTAVGDHIDGVPKGKFVVLMNQLSSKLLAEASQFQTILSNLVARICANHPYHGMNHIYSGSKGTGKDEGAKLRAAAATDIAHRLQGDPEANKYWSKIYRANEYYNAMAWMKEKEFRTGKDYSMGKYRVSAKMMSTIPTLKIPPITLHMPVLAHLVDYAQQPYIVNFKPVMGIANGLSQPKVVTAQASDGRSYKQLVSRQFCLYFSTDHDSTNLEMTTSVKTPSWSKCLSTSASCSEAIPRRGCATCKSGRTESSRCRRKRASLSLSKTPCQ